MTDRTRDPRPGGLPPPSKHQLRLMPSLHRLRIRLMRSSKVREIEPLAAVPVAALTALQGFRMEPTVATAHRSSLFASWSNHMANSVNCVPDTRRRATRTMVAVVMSLPQPSREIVTTRPRRKPTTVISAPSA